jgi:hypothetical protein
VADPSRSLEVDLEQDVHARGRCREWGSIQVAQELGPLDEAPAAGVRLEARPIHEHIGILGLTRSALPGRPGPAEPESGIPRHQLVGDRALAGTARAEEDEEE